MLKFKLIEKQVHLESSDAFDARIQNFFLKGGGGGGFREIFKFAGDSEAYLGNIYRYTYIYIGEGSINIGNEMF